jgi:hypothetical protein
MRTSLSHIEFANHKLKQLARKQALALKQQNFVEHEALALKVIQIQDCLRRADDEEGKLQAKLDAAVSAKDWKESAVLQDALWRVANLHAGEFVQGKCRPEVCDHGPFELNARHWSCCCQPKHDSPCCFGGPELGNHVYLEGEASEFGVIVDLDMTFKMDSRTIAVAFNSAKPQEIFYWVQPEHLIRIAKHDTMASQGGHIGHYHVFDDTEWANTQPGNPNKMLKLIQDPETGVVQQQVLKDHCDASCEHQQKPEYLHSPLHTHWTCCGQRAVYALCSKAHLYEDVKDERVEDHKAAVSLVPKFAFGDWVTESNEDASGVVLELKLDANGRADEYLVAFQNGHTIWVKSKQVEASESYVISAGQYARTSHMRKQLDAVFLTDSHILRFDPKSGNLVGVSTRSLDSCKKFCKHGNNVVFQQHWSCCSGRSLDGYHNEGQGCGFM